MGDDLKKLTEDIEDFSVETDYKLDDLASGPVPDPATSPTPPATEPSGAQEADAGSSTPAQADEAPARADLPAAAPSPAAAPRPDSTAPAGPASAQPPAPTPPLPDKLEIPKYSPAQLDEDGNPIDPRKALEEFKRRQGMASALNSPGAVVAVAVAEAVVQTHQAAVGQSGGAQPQRGEMLKLHRPDFGPEEEAAVLGVLRSGWLTKGPRVVEFERAFSQRVGTPAALGLNSCTAALHTALMSAGLRPGDEVIVPAMTFAASANVVVHCGATPVFCDVDEATHCFDAAQAAGLVSSRTRALIPVHFAGIPCDMAPIWELAAKHDLFVLEDCAHAVETEYRGRPVGATLRADAPGGGSRFGAYSFYATKNLICGEGGMLTCADPADLERARVVSLHGMSVDAWKRYSGADGEKGGGEFKLYDIVAAGYKYNMFELQAALGLVQLGKIDANWERRRQLVAHYDVLLAQSFPDGEFSGLNYPDYGKSAHHLYIARTSAELAPRRDEIIRGLRARNVEAYVHYICLTGTQFYRENYSTSPRQTPVAASLAQRSITLPLYPTMQPADVEYAVAMLKEALG